MDQYVQLAWYVFLLIISSKDDFNVYVPREVAELSAFLKAEITQIMNKSNSIF